MGRKQLKDDYAKAAQVFGKEGSHITDLQYDPETVVFCFEAKGHSVSFTLGIDDAYPEGSMLFPSDGDPKTYSVPLLQILDNVNQEYCKKFGLSTQAYTTPLQDEPAKAPSRKPTMRDSYEEDDDEEDEGMDGEVFERAATLVEDLALLHAHTDCVVTFREYQSLDVLDIELHIHSKFIDHRIASAWGLHFGIPITVRLSVSPSMYTSSMSTPKVEVLQATARCGLSTQLTQIITQFCAAHWQKFSHSKRKALPATNKPPRKTIKLNSKQDLPPLPPSVKEKDVVKLLEMGFQLPMCISALAASHGNLDKASHMLLDDESLRVLEEAEKKKKSGEVDMFEQERRDKENKKFHVDHSEGFLLQLYKYVSFRIPTLNNYCVICDGNHLFAGGACLLRPAVCARELCCFAFQALGVMSDAAEGIATQAEVVDLLVCMAKAAASSARKDIILEPFPTLAEPGDRSKMILSPVKKDFAILQEIFNVFPSIEDIMLAQEISDMKSHLDAAHVYCFPLLQWIINSNRSHIEKLPESKHLKSIGTPYQYVLLSAPPEKEASFNALKAKHGTIFAFHGSPVENWHCILRTGLRNASGTKLQLNGAAYGNGIYLSPLAQTSFGYAANRYYGTQAAASPPKKPSKDGRNRFLGSSSFHCVALCEVINTPSIRKNSSIWVCPEEDHVITRFFFVYPIGSANVANANTEDEAFLTEVRAVLAMNS